MWSYSFSWFKLLYVCLLRLCECVCQSECVELFICMHARLRCVSLWGLFGRKKILELGQHAVECELSPWQQPSVLLPAFIRRVRVEPAKPSVPSYHQIDWSEYLKKHLFIYPDFWTKSPVTLTGLSPQCPSVGLDQESFERWQNFSKLSNSVNTDMQGIVYVSVFVSWWLMKCGILYFNWI